MKQVLMLLRWWLCIYLLLATVSCAQWPERPDSATAATQTNKAGRILELAHAEVGTPYLYGGDTPKGFDCSGLVYYIYHLVGINIPRTANEQFYASHPVTLANLQPGDLVFFEIAGDSQMHVGIYIGNRAFIHAPETGASVSYARLDNPYWNSRFVGGGRF